MNSQGTIISEAIECFLQWEVVPHIHYFEEPDQMIADAMAHIGPFGIFISAKCGGPALCCRTPDGWSN